MMFPTIHDLEVALNFARSKGFHPVAFHHDMGVNAYWSSWQSILLNDDVVVFGSRMALFAPFSHVEEILMVDSSSDDYVQSEQDPRYDAREAVGLLSHIHSFPVFLLDS